MALSKDPNAVVDFPVDWSPWLEDDTIASSTWVDVDTGVTVTNSSFTATTTTVWLSGGTAERKYKLTNRIVTAGGRTNDKTITVLVRER